MLSPMGATEGQVLIYTNGAWATKTLISSYAWRLTSPMNFGTTYAVTLPGVNYASVCQTWDPEMYLAAHPTPNTVDIVPLTGIVVDTYMRVSCVNP